MAQAPLEDAMREQTCNTCNRPANRPFRVYDERNTKVTMGCVDAFHSGHLITPSESSFWHNRSEARHIRGEYKTWMALGTTRKGRN